MPSADVIVVGLGAVGSATCLQLARRGASVIGLDAHRPPHPLGSTHGDSRITRHATFEGAAYVPLAQRSHELWREIEDDSGRSLLRTCGGLRLAPAEPDTTSDDRSDTFTRTVEAARGHGVPHELLTSEETEQRWPQFRLSEPHRVYYEPGAGYLLPEAAVEAQLQLAARSGAELSFGEQMRRFSAGPDGVTVETASGSYSAGRMVLAAGPWAPQMVEDPAVRRVLSVRRQTLHWFEVDADPQDYMPDRFPVFAWRTGSSREPTSFYGLPLIGDVPGVKVARASYGPPVHPDTVDRTVTGEETQDMHASYLAGRFPGLSTRQVKGAVCLYTVTPDGDFVLDELPGSPRVLLASPCSGHGFKHSAAIGEALAQRLLEGHSEIDLSAFSLARFHCAR